VNRLNGFADLTAQQRLFALEYHKEPNHLTAADAAGIGRTAAMRTFRDPLVQEFLKHLREKQEHYTLIDKGFIEVQYLSLYGKLIGEEDVAFVDKEGDTQMVRKFHASEAVSLLRDMAKTIGVLKEEGANVTFNMNNVNLTDEQKSILDAALDAKF
jgi:phage terminase small subunit